MCFLFIFFCVFFLYFLQLVERKKLTAIGPRRGRGGVSYSFPTTYSGSSSVVIPCTMRHATRSVVAKHTAGARMSKSSSFIPPCPPRVETPSPPLVRSQAVHSWVSCYLLPRSSLQACRCDRIAMRYQVDHRETSRQWHTLGH